MKEKTKTPDVLNNYVWKYPKTVVNGEVCQESKLLMDMDYIELQKHSIYCNTMLYNSEKSTLGRYEVLKLIQEQRQKCNAELALRYLEVDFGIPRFKFLEMLNTFVDQNKENYPHIRDEKIEVMIDKISSEYKNIKIDMLFDACMDKLGKLDKKHITLAFIVEQGLWFEPSEMTELLEYNDDGTIKDRLEVIKERLSLKYSTNLTIKPSGLSYKEFRAMVLLNKSKKYSELSSDQLKTLRNKILFRLEERVRKHIDFWSEKQNEITKVMQHKGYIPS